MTTRLTVVIVAGDSTLAFARTVDSVIRQSNAAAVQILVASHQQQRLRELFGSIAQRINAHVVSAPTISSALNQAVTEATGRSVLMVPAGFRLKKDCVAQCIDALGARPGVAAIAPAVQFQSSDGTRRSSWIPETTLPGLILNPSRGPQVLAVSRDWWVRCGGPDPSFGPLAGYEFCVRLALGNNLQPLSSALVSADAADGFELRLVEDHDYLPSLSRVYERHRASLAQLSSTLLLERLVTAHTLATRHRTLVSRRDEGATELEDNLRQIGALRSRLAEQGSDSLDWGDFGRTDPISRDWGYDRGGPVDRYYIEGFIQSNSSEISGRVLEVQEDDLSRTYGALRVAHRDVVDINDSNPRATIFADLRWAPHLGSDTYDCIIITQTLHVIDDMPGVVKECFRILKPGGTLLATFPAASRVCLEYGEDGDLWRLTPAGAKALLEPVFGAGAVAITPYGNVQSNVAFLYGLGRGELTREQLDAYDPYYPALTGARAVKHLAGARRRTGRPRGAVLLYHRVDEQNDVHALNVAPANFASHLQWLSSNCTVMPIDQFMATPAHERPERAVALTFDDGYLDNLLEAAPRLQSEGLPATFFLTTRWLHEIGEYWWDLLERAFGQCWDGWPEISVDLPGGTTRLPAQTPDERASSHRRLHGVLVSLPLDARERVVAALTSAIGPARSSRRPMLADEVRRLASFAGATIGAHTVNHLALPSQPDVVLRSELVESQAELCRVLGRPVDVFAYPYGAVDDRSAAGTRSLYKWAIACGERIVPDSCDAALVPRIEVKNWDEATFATRMERALAERLPGV